MAPLQSQSFAQQSFFFATCSKLAYLRRKDGIPAFGNIGFSASYISKNGSQVYVISNQHDIVIVCRGTEPTQFEDIKADLDVNLVTFSDKAEVHDGFNKSVDNVWVNVDRAIKKQDERRVWITGHSLGAAMATIIAVRLAQQPSTADKITLFTYGSPRVGNKDMAKLIDSCGITHHRFVNNADIVTRVPTRPYKHCGNLVYMNHWGNIRKVTGWQIIKDRVRGFVKGLKKGKINFFVNHSIDRYCANLERWSYGIENPETII